MKTEEQLKEDLILKKHNFSTYQKIEEMFNSGINRVGLVQATGTGKSFIALQWLFDNCFMRNDKNILYLTSSNPIIRNFDDSMKKVGIDKNVVFKNLDEKIYSSVLQRDFDLAKQYDYIILDEFHRVGAEKWSGAVKTILAMNPNARVLGLSATPIRYLDEGRDMAKELFGESIVNGINLLEAVNSGILPKADYVPVFYSYAGKLTEMQEKTMKIQDRGKQKKFKDWISKAKRRVEEAEGLEDIFARKIKKKNGRLLLFCTDVEQFASVKQQIKDGLFKKVNQDVLIYEISYKDSTDKVAKTIEAFKNDDSKALKVMLSVEMFNEGVHIDDLDGCAMFRKTFSPRLWLQQIGRVLSVGKEREPLIFDIVNNYENLNTIREMFLQGFKGGGEDVELQDYFPFHIDEVAFDFNNYLEKLDALLSYYSLPTQQYLESAERYANKYHNLRMKYDYIEENTNIRVGRWLGKIRNNYNRNLEACDKIIINRLLAIDPDFHKYTKKFEISERDEKILESVKAFTIQKGCSPVPKRYKYNDFSLGEYIERIKGYLKNKKDVKLPYKFSEELIVKILEINPMALATKQDQLEERDKKIREFAKLFVEKNGTVPFPLRGNENATQDEKWFAIKISNIKANLEKDGTRYLQKLKDNNTCKYTQSLIDELFEINPNGFKSKDEVKLERDKEILKKVEQFTLKFGQVPIPTNVRTLTDGDEAKFRSQISRIKTSLLCNESSYYLDLIQEILKINPNAFKSKDDKRKEKNDELLQWVGEFVKKYGQVPISGLGKRVRDDDHRQLLYLSKIKKYCKYGKNLKYNPELVEEILKIDPNAFKSKEEVKFDRDRMLLEWTKLYTDMYGEIPIPIHKDETLTVEENEFRRQYGIIRRFLSENKNHIEKRNTSVDLFSEELIAQILEINPNAFGSKDKKKSD